jgi:diguanylate cyclase (GGDEF)-like protein
MRNPALRLNEPDPALLNKLALIEQGYLAVVALIAIGALCASLVPAFGHLLPSDWVPIQPQVAMAALLSAAGLELTRPGQPRPSQWIGCALAGLLALLGVTVLIEHALHVSFPVDFFGTAHPGRMPSLTALAFVVMAAAILLIGARTGTASLLADLFVSVFCVLVLVIVSRFMFEGLAALSREDQTSLLTLFSLALLAFVAFMRRAELGVFATLLGAGSGGRIARIAAPLALLVPFLPQAALVHAVNSGLVRAQDLSVIAEFFAAGVSLAIMLFMAVKINRLEKKIRDLSLYDDVTGLYNRRGFHVVAWQALRQARRSSLPFSILFIDLEEAPPSSRSEEWPSPALLAATADLLRASFRATDVIGRIDPAQFAVAGHFHGQSINLMRLRLQEAANYRNSDPGRSVTLAFTVSSAVAADPQQESLDDLLARANQPTDQEAPDAEPIAEAPRPARRD